MSLPLLEHVNAAGVALMPLRAPRRGEQYRFHVDMTRCIGCKCCVVACNEQNANPAAITWRRVAEIESGRFPATRRGFLSMGCNHCLDPTCLRGCPADAYTKDPSTGIVRHSAEACIGCQYCTWTCSYGVPQYDAARGVVSKCDLCHARLEHGQAPACVSACPEGAIRVEMVSVAAWRGAVGSGAGGGVPAGDGSISTTLVTVPRGLPRASRAVNERAGDQLQPAHGSLVLMTVLTQMSAGAFVAASALRWAGAVVNGQAVAAIALSAATVGLGAATLHLGQPRRAYRAVLGWRRSWLSREVLLFAAFAAAAACDTALWLRGTSPAIVGAVAGLLGAVGVAASACIYRVPSRPAWDTPLTPLDFALTAATLGPLLAAAAGALDSPWLSVAIAAAATAQASAFVARVRRMRRLATALRWPAGARIVLLAAGGIVLPLVGGSSMRAWAAVALALAGELLGRYIFFAGAAPAHMASPYVAIAEEEAA